MADLTEIGVKFQSNYDTLKKAFDGFVKGYNELTTFAPNLAKLLENVVYTSFMHELPGAFADSVIGIFSSPKDAALFLGAIVSNLGATVALTRLARVGKLIRVIVKQIVEDVLGKLNPYGKDLYSLLATAAGKGLQLGTKQIQNTADAITKALNLVQEGATVAILTSYHQVSLADVVREFIAYPKQIAEALSRLDKAVSAIPAG